MKKKGGCRGRRVISLFLLLLLFSPFPACSPSQTPHVPSWIKRTPAEHGYVYAVGSCGKTFFPRDAENCARRDGVVNLALMLNASVSEKTVTFTGKHTVTTESALDVYLPVDILAKITEKAEVVDIWYDEKGLSGPPGTTYALLRTPLKEIAQFGAARPPQEEWKDITLSAVNQCKGSFSKVLLKSKIAAEGICPPRFFRKDAMLCARKEAFAELARIIVVSVKEVILDFVDNSRTGSYIISTIITDAVLNGAVLDKFFFDENGNAHAVVSISGKNLTQSIENTAKHLRRSGKEGTANLLTCLLKHITFGK